MGTSETWGSIHSECSHELSKEAIRIRTEVFDNEQGFTGLVDEVDGKSDTLHVMLYDDEEAVGTCRLFPEEPGSATYIVGRFAVIKSRRGERLGKKLLISAERAISRAGGHKVKLAAQKRAQGFYEHEHYVPIGEEFLEQDYPHIWMEKLLTRE